MKRIVVILWAVFLTACTEIDYREEKKIVIRKPKERIEEPYKVIKLELGGGANFENDRWSIRREDEEKLEAFAETIVGRYGSLSIVGHTDRRGREEYNKGLSLKRAQAVAAYLDEIIALESYDLTIEGRGEEEPLNDGESKEDRAANRRVEIIFREY